MNLPHNDDFNMQIWMSIKAMNYKWIRFNSIDSYWNHLIAIYQSKSLNLLQSRTNTRLQHTSLIVSVFDWHCLSQSHQQSKKHTGNQRRANLLCCLMKYLPQSMLQLFGHTKIWCHRCEPSKQHHQWWYKRTPHLRY